MSENSVLTTQLHGEFVAPESTGSTYPVYPIGASSALSQLVHHVTPMNYSFVDTSERAIAASTRMGTITERLRCSAPTSGQTRFLRALRLKLNIPAIYAFPTATATIGGSRVGFATWCNDVLGTALRSLTISVNQDKENGFIIVKKDATDDGSVGAWVHFKRSELSEDDRRDQGVYRSFDDCLAFSCVDNQVYLDIDVPFIRMDGNMSIDAIIEWNPVKDFVCVMSGDAASTTRPTDGASGLGSYPVLQSQSDSLGRLPYVADLNPAKRGTSTHFRTLNDTDVTFNISATYVNMCIPNDLPFPAAYGNQSIVEDWHVQTMSIPLGDIKGTLTLSLQENATVKKILAYGVHSMTAARSYGLSFLAGGFGYDIGSNVGLRQGNAGPANRFEKMFTEAPILIHDGSGTLASLLLANDANPVTNTVSYNNSFSQGSSVSRFPVIDKMTIGGRPAAIAGRAVAGIPGLKEFELCEDSQTLGVKLQSNFDLVISVDPRLRNNAQRDTFTYLTTAGVQAVQATGMSDNPRMRSHSVQIFAGFKVSRRIMQTNDNSLTMAVV